MQIQAFTEGDFFRIRLFPEAGYRLFYSDLQADFLLQQWMRFQSGVMNIYAARLSPDQLEAVVYLPFQLPDAAGIIPNATRNMQRFMRHYTGYHIRVNDEPGFSFHRFFPREWLPDSEAAVQAARELLQPGTEVFLLNRLPQLKQRRQPVAIRTRALPRPLQPADSAMLLREPAA